jgi:membrane protein DedA with SNARE-associated domain
LHPFPDEPVIIPLGLLKYNPIKFFGAYFFGKLAIAVAGAFLGNVIETSIAGWISFELTVVFSIIITIVITLILLKVDVRKLAEDSLIGLTIKPS